MPVGAWGEAGMSKGPDGDLGRLSLAIGDFLKLPAGDSELLPKAGELMKALRTHISGSEHLRRYRAVRERMARDEDSFFAPPNFAYTLHSA